MKSRTCLAIVALLPLLSDTCLPLRAEDAPPDFIVVPGVRQLFLDDVGVGEIHGLARTLHPPRRHPGNPVVQADRPWENNCSLYGTVLFDAERKQFRMYYLTNPRDRGLRMLELGGGRQRPPHTTLAAYAESSDGMTWTKPELGQFSYDGSTGNNLLGLGADNCEGVGVLYDPADPDSTRRFKCLYWDHGSGGFEVRDGKPYSKDGPRDGLCAAVSADGLHWKPLAENPVLRRYCDTTQNLLFDKRLKRYVAFSRLGFGRVMARSESQDFSHWSEPAIVLRCDEADGPAAQIYGAGVDLYEGTYLAMIWIYREGTDATIDTQLATSRDGIHWTRVADRAVWLGLGETGSWEDGMVRSVARIIPRGDQLYIYYGGVNGPHNRPGRPPVERRHRGALGLVTVPRDRFVSLDAGDSEGELLTQPFQLPPGALHLNADAAGGELRVAVCDVDGIEFDEYKASQPVAGDQMDSVVSWGNRILAPLTGGHIRLRFTARNARLYSYWFAPQQR